MGTNKEKIKELNKKIDSLKQDTKFLENNQHIFNGGSRAVENQHKVWDIEKEIKKLEEQDYKEWYLKEKYTTDEDNKNDDGAVDKIKYLKLHLRDTKEMIECMEESIVILKNNNPECIEKVIIDREVAEGTIKFLERTIKKLEKEKKNGK